LGNRKEGDEIAVAFFQFLISNERQPSSSGELG
jgi:hypothetical protein